MVITDHLLKLVRKWSTFDGTYECTPFMDIQVHVTYKLPSRKHFLI